MPTPSELVWEGAPTLAADGSVDIHARFRGLLVHFTVFDDYGTSFDLIEGSEETCYDAYEAFCEFLDSRRIVKYRLLEWGRAQGDPKMPRPQSRIVSVTGSSGELFFDVEVEGVRFPIVVEGDLHSRWPGDVGPSVNERLAWPGLEACYARIDADRDFFRELGFETGALDSMPSDPLIPSRPVPSRPVPG